MKKYKYIKVVFFLLSLIFAIAGKVEARHIIGGDITYTCIGMDTVAMTVTFRFDVTIYRDCAGGGAQYDPNFTFGIYLQEASGAWSFFGEQNVNLGSVTEIDSDADNPCLIVPPNICVEEGKYSFIRTLRIQSTPYRIVYMRCCRNNSISNIYDPGDQGAAYTVEISPEAQMSCNNSPRFRNFPPVIICGDEPLYFDHGADDAEGDNLVYEFCAPEVAGGQVDLAGPPCPPPGCDCVFPPVTTCLPPYDQVRFRSPAYTSLAPLGGSPVVTIDQITGLISGTPVNQGQFVVGVCVKEYRNGVLLSTLRRDFQFNIAQCEKTVVAEIENDGVVNGQEFIINSCGNNTVDFVNLSHREDFIVDYYWEFDINGQLQTYTTKNATVTFPGIGTYKGIMILNRTVDAKLGCSDTADITVNVYPEIEANFAFDYDTCIAGPVVFTDSSFSGSGLITNWDWDFDDGGSSVIPSPLHDFLTPGSKQVNLRVTDVNDCRDDITKVVDYFPVPPVLIIEPSTFRGCTPADIFFKNLSVPIDSTYDITWDFGDGGTGHEVSPRHIYTEPGVYSIKIEVTSPIGCYTSAEFPLWITVQPSPTADFTFNPTELNRFNKTVNFYDQSTGAHAWQWNFDGKAFKFDQNPTYEFKDTGMHRIELIVLHESGCPDTIVKFIDVVPNATFYMPNAFSPNGDGNNDRFFGKGVLEGSSNFSMTIWNRWGEQVFETNDPAEGWDGTLHNQGASAPIGVYLYIVTYIDPRGNAEELKGYATLIR